MSIKAVNLSHTYHPGTPLETCALKNISFEFHRRTWFSVVGHTGSGKSTLAQHLNGLLLPMEGQVWVDGMEVKEKSRSLQDIRRKVGLVFQYPEQQLFAETVYDEIAFAPRNWGVPENEIPQRVSLAMEQAGLERNCLKRSPFNLSGGEKRKAAIASVLSSVPDYLVLDEPTAGLDSYSRKELTSLLVRLRAEGMGILLVTHDLDIALQFSDSILVLQGGTQVVWKKPQAVLEHLQANPVPGLKLPDIARLSAALREKGKKVPLTWQWKCLKTALFGEK